MFSVLWFSESYYPERDLFDAIIFIPLWSALKAVSCSSEMCICMTFHWKNIFILCYFTGFALWQPSLLVTCV
jgi:hypothetical protein